MNATKPTPNPSTGGELATTCRKFADGTRAPSVQARRHRWPAPLLGGVGGGFSLAATDALFAATVSPPDLTDIRGLKPIIAPPTPWYWWVLGAVAVAGLVALIIWFIRRRPARPAPPPPPPHVRAKQRLNAALDLLHDPRAFCITVSDALRTYLEERFRLRAPERTTEEFLVELQTSPTLTAGQRQTLAGFLGSCDLVKFARHEPTETDLRALHGNALRLVEETAPATLEPAARR